MGEPPYKTGISLSLDGRPVARRAFDYDRATGELTHTPGKALSFGTHAAEVAAVDDAGTSASRRWGVWISR